MTGVIAHETNAGGMSVLRDVTDELHDAVEAQLQLPDSLRGRDDVAGFLWRWLVLARTLEPIAGRALADSVQPVIASDLAGLGVVPPCDGARPTGVDAPAVTSGDALGTAWVLLGARLGLRTLGPPMRELTGTDIQLCDSIDAGALIELRRRIDRRTGDALEAVMRGATSAFTTARGILQGPPWS